MKVIEFFGEPLSYGGQESFIINMYKHFKEPVNISFITPFHANNVELFTLIKKKGDFCVARNYKFDSHFRKLSILITAIQNVSSDVQVIHIHSGSVFTLLAVAFIAKKKGIKKVIVHSHATGNISLKHSIIKTVSDKWLRNYADVFLACSKEAAEFKYSKEIIQSQAFHIIRNGIELNRYTFNENIREQKRKELNVDKCFVICNVGRFSTEKNHSFLIDVFLEYLKLDNSGVLLLIGGKGETEEEIKNRVSSLGIKSRVLMLSERSDVNELLQAADVFVFPSLFEGLGISAIEAQAAGLLTICSYNVPDEVNVSDRYRRLRLEDGAQMWAQCIFDQKGYKRESEITAIEKAGYSASICAAQLEKLYIGQYT